MLSLQRALPHGPGAREEVGGSLGRQRWSLPEVEHGSRWWAELETILVILLVVLS